MWPMWYGVPTWAGSFETDAVIDSASGNQLISGSQPDCSASPNSDSNSTCTRLRFALESPRATAPGRSGSSRPWKWSQNTRPISVSQGSTRKVSRSGTSRPSAQAAELGPRTLPPTSKVKPPAER